MSSDRAVKKGKEIGVVVPAHNAAGSIGRLLDSLLAQTWDSWRCVVVDDGSTDDTSEVVSKYARKHPGRFRVIRTENRGPYDARVTGLRCLITPWVMFCDADDELLPEAMEALLSQADDSTDMVVGDNEIRFPDGTCRSVASMCAGNIPQINSGKDYAREVFGNEWFMSTCGKLIRHNAIRIPIRIVSYDAIWMRGALEDGVMMMHAAINMRSIRLRPNMKVYVVHSDPHGQLKSFIPGANEFVRFSRFVIAEEMGCWDRGDRGKVRAEVALYMSRLAYAMLIAKGVKVDGDDIKYLRQISARGCKSPKATLHDRKIALMMRSAHLRRVVSRRHAQVEAGLRPFFSVIVSAYNVERVIERTIRSVTDGNFFHRFEIIVVDDASTDATAKVVKVMAKADRRIKLVRHDKNKGLNATRLTGLAEAMGEWVLFADAGDRLCRDLLTDLHDHIRMRCDMMAPGLTTDCVFFGIRSRSSRLPLEGTLWRTPAISADAKAMDSQMLFPQLLRKQGMPSALCNKAYRRDLLLGTALTAESKFYGEDHLTTLKIFDRNFGCTFLGRPGYIWYTGGGSHQSVEEQWESECDLAERTIALLKSLGRDNATNISLLAESLHESLLEGLARLLCSGLRNDEDLQKTIDSMASKEVYRRLAVNLSQRTPTPADARAHYAAHRLAFIAKKWL